MVTTCPVVEHLFLCPFLDSILKKIFRAHKPFVTWTLTWYSKNLATRLYKILIWSLNPLLQNYLFGIFQMNHIQKTMQPYSQLSCLHSFNQWNSENCMTGSKIIQYHLCFLLEDIFQATAPEFVKVSYAASLYLTVWKINADRTIWILRI